MTRYFFDVSGNPGNSLCDYVGEELRDDWAAWREALSQVRIVEDSLSPGGTLHLHVRDESREVFQLTVFSHWIVPPKVSSPSIATSEDDVNPRLVEPSCKASDQ